MKRKMLIILLIFAMTFSMLVIPFKKVDAALGLPVYHEKATLYLNIKKIAIDKEIANAKRVTVNIGGKDVTKNIVKRLIKNPTTHAKEIKYYEIKGETLTEITNPNDQFILNFDNGENIFPGNVGLDGTKYHGQQLFIGGGDIYKMYEFFGAGSSMLNYVYMALRFDSGPDKGRYVKAYFDKDTNEFDNTRVGFVNGKPVATDNIDEAVGGLTTNLGEIQFEIHEYDYDNDVLLSWLEGEFEIVEIPEKSEFVSENRVLTGGKSVPLKIKLPIVDENGILETAFLYPKNYFDTPLIDKNFGKENNTGDNNKDNDLVHADGFEDPYAGAGAKAGAQYENSEKRKETAKVELGKLVPYEVKTEIPSDAKLRMAKWDDKMTDGLTYNKDIVLTIGDDKYKKNPEINNGEKDIGSISNLTEEENGFILDLNEEGLKLINAKKEPVTIYLQYKARVNSNAVADIPEANDIMFHYGNSRSKTSTPIPTKPNEYGELELEKDWTPSKNAGVADDATFELVDVNTGEIVKAEDLIDPHKTPNTDFEEYRNNFSAEIKIKNPRWGESPIKTYTWKYLDKNKQYKVLEKRGQYGFYFNVEYKKGSDGKIKIVNHMLEGPMPINPTAPRVVVGGKKFVKTNNADEDDMKRLLGAEFFVKNSGGEFLTRYEESAGRSLTDAKAQLDKAVENYNTKAEEYVYALNKVKDWPTNILDLGSQDSREQAEKAIEVKLEELKAEVNSKQAEYNNAIKISTKKYEWKTGNPKDIDNIVRLVSDVQGRFEISGLSYGDYYLVENKAPKGYAKISSDIGFKVEKGSYDGYSYEEGAKKAVVSPTHIQYTEEIKAKEGEVLTDAEVIENAKNSYIFGQRIINNKLSIPQTGGIGALIFNVVGFLVMAGAIILYKKSKIMGQAIK